MQLLGNEDLKTFDIYCHQQLYDSNKNLTLQTIVCCSSTLTLHIKRAYLQTRYWVTAHDAAALVPDPLELGYLDSDIGVQPLMVQ